MQLILTADVPNLGDMGDVVDVANGYGRNYLIPQNLAVRASNNNARQFEHVKRQVEIQSVRLRARAVDARASFDDVSITLARRTTSEDKLFGSVTVRDIITALEEVGLTTDNQQVILDAPIKELGIYKVPIRLHADVIPDVCVWVVKM